MEKQETSTWLQNQHQLVMTSEDKAYPFEFIGISKDDADEYQQDTLIYRFHSAKSGHRYEVHIERYIEHLCCVKFFDNTATHGLGKYSQLSNTFEPRTIFRTLTLIVLEALKQDPLASFCFIGAADSRDDTRGVRTRRYRVYQAYVQNLDIDDLFESAFYDQHSLALLINRKAVKDFDTYANRILEFI